MRAITVVILLTVAAEEPSKPFRAVAVRGLTAADFTLDDNGVPQLFHSVYLTRLVEETGGSWYEATSGGLRDAFVRVADEFRSRYVITYVADGVAAAGWHDIRVTVRGKGMQVQARRGYLR